MTYSIQNLPATYTLTQEFLTRFHSEWVIRLEGKFLFSSSDEGIAKQMAKFHCDMQAVL